MQSGSGRDDGEQQRWSCRPHFRDRVCPAIAKVVIAPVTGVSAFDLGTRARLVMAECRLVLSNQTTAGPKDLNCLP